MENSSFAFWNFLKFFLGGDIFHPWLIECMEVEPADTKGQLYIKNI